MKLRLEGPVKDLPIHNYRFDEKGIWPTKPGKARHPPRASRRMGPQGSPLRPCARNAGRSVSSS